MCYLYPAVDPEVFKRWFQTTWSQMFLTPKDFNGFQLLCQLFKGSSGVADGICRHLTAGVVCFPVSDTGPWMQCSIKPLRSQLWCSSGPWDTLLYFGLGSCYQQQDYLIFSRYLCCLCNNHSLWIHFVSLANLAFHPLIQNGDFCRRSSCEV